VVEGARLDIESGRACLTRIKPTVIDGDKSTQIDVAEVLESEGAAVSASRVPEQRT
jgi:hypothetical protein